MTAADSATPVVDVVVVGGGIAGLVVARDLAAAGRSVTVLEAEDRLGGCVARHEVAGLVLDAGAESFATRSPAVGALLTDLGLGHDVVTPTADGAWLQLPGATLPLPRTGVLGIPGDLWSADVRRAIGVRGSLRASLDRVLPGRVGLGATGIGSRRTGPPGSLGRLVQVRLGRRVLDRLVAPVVSGVHSAHPDHVDLDAVLPGVRSALRPHGPVPGPSLSRVVGRMRAAAPAGSAVAGVRGGMYRLITALADDLTGRGVEVRTGVRAEALDRADDGTWTVGCAGLPPVQGRTVVVAVPSRPGIDLLQGVVPPVRTLADAIPTGVLLVTLVVESAALDTAPRGSGVLVADGTPGVHAKALTHATAKWSWLAEAAGPGRHVLRLSYGRAGAPPPSGPQGEIVQTAVADARTLLGVPLTTAQVLGSAVTAWDGGLPHARPGHRKRVALVRRELAGTPGIWACGAWLAGTGLAAVVRDAHLTAESALSEHAPT
ncbi:MAG: protoporphyrinogen oxidase [Actinotalea sp.]|nr:protoporphyrinogen oxidase [Actinotalea sp.]